MIATKIASAVPLAGAITSRAEAATPVTVERAGPFSKAQKLVELGYLSLESKGDPKKEGVAIQAYLGDSLYASGKIFHERSLSRGQTPEAG